MYIGKFRIPTNRFCFKCHHRVFHSDVKGYPYVCPHCDETCRLTVPDDVSEIEVAEIFKKTHEDKDVYVKNKDGYFRNFRSM